MKTLVLTAYDDAFAPLGDITSPIMDRYATRHGCDFRLRRARPLYTPPLWWKLQLVTEALVEGYHQVFWLDADMLITNPEIEIRGLREGIHFSRDWGVDATEDGHFSCGAYVASWQCLEIFSWCNFYEGKYIRSPFGDQDALRGAYQSGEFTDLFRFHPRRDFNAVPIEVHPSVVEPWQPGDFLCHLTMIPLAERVALAHKILSQ